MILCLSIGFHPKPGRRWKSVLSYALIAALIAAALTASPEFVSYM
jgi:hypothetical protein